MAGRRPPLEVLPGGKAAGARALAPLSDEALLALTATPEGDLALAQVALYLASTAKSNAAYAAFNAAKADVEAYGTQEVPLHIRNAPTKLMKSLGYGKDYQYDHDVEGGIALDQTGFPDAMGERVYYEPLPRGMELKLKEKLDALRTAREQARQGRSRKGPG